VSIAVITMLAASMMIAVTAVRQSAREEATRGTIVKLNRIIMAKWESYRTRRVPIDTTGATPLAAAQLRLAGIRDLMRMEMPDRANDVTSGPIATGLTTEPQIHAAYKARAGSSMNNYASAECLYLIVTLACNARDQFSEQEIGDVDKNGLPEFLDGWGNPIKFLRWAPAFLPPNSDVQTGDTTHDHDPFDPRHVDTSAQAFRLVPLIYSAGRDGIYDINVVPGAALTASGDLSSYANAGQPLDSDNISVTATGPANGRLDCYDNITNHRLEAK
jgi:hypothetical protein